MLGQVMGSLVSVCPSRPARSSTAAACLVWLVDTENVVSVTEELNF